MSDQNELSAMVLAELRTGIEQIRQTAVRIERTVYGDIDSGNPSLRESVKNLAAELDSETVSLDHRLTSLENGIALERARNQGMLNAIKWVSGGSLIGLIGVIAALLKLLGGGA